MFKLDHDGATTINITCDAETQKKLEHFDWYYDCSDDYRVVKRWRAVQNELIDIMGMENWNLFALAAKTNFVINFINKEAPMPKTEETVKNAAKELNSIARLFKMFNCGNETQVQWLHEAEERCIVNGFYDRKTKQFWYQFDYNWYMAHRQKAREIINSIKRGARKNGHKTTWSKKGNCVHF